MALWQSYTEVASLSPRMYIFGIFIFFLKNVLVRSRTHFFSVKISLKLPPRQQIEFFFEIVLKIFVKLLPPSTKSIKLRHYIALQTMLRSNNSIPPITIIWIKAPLLSSLIFLQVLNWISVLRNLGARYFPSFSLVLQIWWDFSHSMSLTSKVYKNS